MCQQLPTGSTANYINQTLMVRVMAMSTETIFEKRKQFRTNVKHTCMADRGLLAHLLVFKPHRSPSLGICRLLRADQEKRKRGSHRRGLRSRSPCVVRVILGRGATWDGEKWCTLMQISLLAISYSVPASIIYAFVLQLWLKNLWT